jgi:hypothetical protein
MSSLLSNVEPLLEQIGYITDVKTLPFKNGIVRSAGRMQRNHLAEIKRSGQLTW